MLKTGLYDLFGNTVEYFEDDDYGYDLDSGDDVPVELLLAMGDFIQGFED